MGVGIDLELKIAFRMLKKAFTEAPILHHFNPRKPTILKTDSSSFAMAGTLNQYNGFGILCSGNVYSRK
jgi:hypothetical protein